MTSVLGIVGGKRAEGPPFPPRSAEVLGEMSVADTPDRESPVTKWVRRITTNGSDPLERG